MWNPCSLWKWLRRTRTIQPAALPPDQLKGAPPHARTKTYSAETGFVYQYVYRGYRPTPKILGTEHVFEANRAGAHPFRVTIHLLDTELAHCAEAIGRQVIAAERYALVKMTLLAAFDEFADLPTLSTPLVPDATSMQEHLRTLGRI